MELIHKNQKICNILKYPDVKAWETTSQINDNGKDNTDDYIENIH